MELWGADAAAMLSSGWYWLVVGVLGAAVAATQGLGR